MASPPPNPSSIGIFSWGFPRAMLPPGIIPAVPTRGSKIFLYAKDSSGGGGVHMFWVSPLGPPRTTSPLLSLHRKYLTCLSSPRKLFTGPRACFLPTDLREDLLKSPLLGPVKPVPDVEDVMV